MKQSINQLTNTFFFNAGYMIERDDWDWKKNGNCATQNNFVELIWAE